MAEYIEREALLNSIYENPESQHNLRVAQLLEAIMYHPVADVAPVVHGRWITDKKGVIYCGRCRIIDDYAGVHYYCPFCGARMDGE